MSELISALKDVGKGKESLIIGGGESVKDFDFSRVPEMIRIVVNDTVHLNTRVDFNIYRDLSYKERLIKRGRRLLKGVKIIGHTNHLVPWADYQYDWNAIGINFIHTGADAVFIADRIMGFKRVYLIGFDYTSKGKAVHYYGNDDPKSDYYKSERDRRIFRRALFKNGLKDFDRVDWNGHIYNCSKISKLTKFEHKLPWEVV